jgi:hypothetical protein
MVFHATLAAFVNVREFALEDEEARKLSEAAKDVMRHYPIGFSEKTLAWVNLGVVGCGVYGTRFMAYQMRKGAERKERMATVPASAPGAAPGAAPPPAANGHAADLTPPFLTVPPEGESIP